MNKTVIAAASIAAAFSGPAAAQSTVTLFGVVDVNPRSVKNNLTQKRLDTSGLQSSRLGFRGVEEGIVFSNALFPSPGTPNAAPDALESVFEGG